MTEISFKTTAEESELIHKIAHRAFVMFGADPIGTSMDITAAHANGCPLDLADLLAADPFNFAHDVGGIIRHIDRDTGKIGGGFLPRFASRAAAPAHEKEG